MQHLEVSCAVGRFFKSLGFKGLTYRNAVCGYKCEFMEVKSAVIYNVAIRPHKG